ncbi:hypothetical protein KP509_02G029300 [Ceratopteris richardii]|uniref:TFIIS N-terminal domain-containing protein n=2 Tax=Ceratopteris richardii TaxID=49495 RepID=A0A8T2VBF8_CERRI|nr:hypothetical protein KP509_02G029300 [Ceratopteris richardii]KAH7443317.1 hypothetical protein KP509_02G029300 [Ceratopteris richardii]
MQEAGDAQHKPGASPQSKAPGDSVESLDSSCISSAKSKKRERLDQSTKAGKKDQFVEEDTNPQKRECLEKLDDEGRVLSSSASVNQLISKMKQEKSSSLQRIMVSNVLVGTMNEEYLKEFVQLGGVTIMEEWIQEWYRMRSSDASTTDGDNRSDEEMSLILQALEKLPIGLKTLKDCTIGKSVKQLRNAKNCEIQKKAKKLVDTWRKRVDLEMEQENILPTVANEQTSQMISQLCPADSGSGRPVVAVSPIINSLEFIHSQGADTSSEAQNIEPIRPDVSNSDTSPIEHVKSAEKDPNKKTARLSGSSSTSTLGHSPAKKLKHSTGVTSDKDSKDDVLNAADCQKVKEKDQKCEGINNHAVNDTAVPKTNEYRKKLRSGSSSALNSQNVTHAVTSHSNAAQPRDSMDAKVVSVKCSQVSHPLGGESLEPFHVNSKDAVDKGERVKDSLPEDAGLGTVNQHCQLSQSSCIEKHKVSCQKVSTMMGKTSPAAALRQGDGVQKLSTKADANPSNRDPAYGFPETVGLANVASNREITSTDCEGPSFSHSIQKSGQDSNVNSMQNEGNAHHTIDPVVHGTASTCDGAPYSENPIIAQNTGNESISVDAPDDCINVGNDIVLKTSSAASDNKTIDNTSEAERVHMKSNRGLGGAQPCHDFDLNEDLVTDEFFPNVQESCDQLLSSISTVSVKASCTLSAPIAVSAATRGAFIPPINASCKSDIGWTGSAATSAFRPAEPRHTPAKMQTTLSSSTDEARNVNNFDLNVADQDDLEECPPLSGHAMQGAQLDLNCVGEEMQSSTAFSDLSNSQHLQAGSPQKLTEKRAVLDFDLNEQLDEVKQEQEFLAASAPAKYVHPASFAALNGYVTFGKDATWHAAEGACYSTTSANGSRIELFPSCPSSQPVAVGPRQVAPASILPSPMPIYSQTAPFYGGPSSTPFPSSLSYNPMIVMPDTTYMASKGMPGTITSTGARSRVETSVRPASLPSIDDFRCSNGLYAWRRSPQDLYANPGVTTISYNDPSVGERELAVNCDRSTSLEEQMRLFQQAAIPVTSLKRREPEFFSGLKQTWH